jgi:hypothetical protein
MAMLYPFPARTAELLERFPVQGEAHRWIARIAAGLRGTFNEERCFTVLSRLCEYVQHRRIPEREIRDAVRFVYGGRAAAAGGGRRGRPPTAYATARRRTTFDWPEADGELMARVIATVEPLFDPARDAGVWADEALQELFAPGELVCMGAVSERPLVRPVEAVAAHADGRAMQRWPILMEVFPTKEARRGRRGSRKGGRGREG